MSVTLPGMLFTITVSPTLNWWEVNTSAPARIPPTKVDMIKPIVMEIMPAPVSRVSGETPSVCSTPKLITIITMAPMKNCRTEAAWAPIRVVSSGLVRRKSNINSSEKLKIRVIRKACLRRVGRFIGAATNRSKI